jgi:hypothetical protein
LVSEALRYLIFAMSFGGQRLWRLLGTELAIESLLLLYSRWRRKGRRRSAGFLESL